MLISKAFASGQMINTTLATRLPLLDEGTEIAAKAKALNFVGDAVSVSVSADGIATVDIANPTPIAAASVDGGTF